MTFVMIADLFAFLPVIYPLTEQKQRADNKKNRMADGIAGATILYLVISNAKRNPAVSTARLYVSYRFAQTHRRIHTTHPNTIAVHHTLRLQRFPV